MTVRTVVFDLGGVLIDWNPRYLYRKLFADEQAMEAFLAGVCTQAWNERQDAGRSIAEATALLVHDFPQHRVLIEAYYDRWEEMLAGAIGDTVTILESLARRGDITLMALTNWSAETFPIARQRFGFLAHFADILVSGEVGLKKPDPAIFRMLLDRHALSPAETVFIDDAGPNVTAARDLGLHAIRFHDASRLRAALDPLLPARSPDE